MEVQPHHWDLYYKLVSEFLWCGHGGLNLVQKTTLSLSLSFSLTSCGRSYKQLEKEKAVNKLWVLLSSLVLLQSQLCVVMGKKRHSEHSNDPFFVAAHNRTRQQPQCTQPDNDGVPEETCAQQNHSPKLASFTSQNAQLFITIPSFVALLLLVSSIVPAMCQPLQGNHTFRPHHELLYLRRVRAHLNKINKPPVKTIQACSFFDPSFWWLMTVTLLFSFFILWFSDVFFLLFCCRVQMVIW